MDGTHWILLTALLAASGAAVWLLLQRAAAQSELAAERTRADEARARAQDAEKRLESLALRLEAADSRADEAVTEARVLAERITGADNRHRAEIEAVHEQYQQRIATEKRSIAEYREELDRRAQTMEQQFKDAIRQSADEAMKRSGEHLIKLAESKIKDSTEKAGLDLEARRAAVENLVKPLSETLKRTDEKLREIEKDRAASFAQIAEQARLMALGQEALRKETAGLVTALRKPQVRGRYGEIQLRRVVELAGMRDYCDFSEQENTTDAEGNALRPDMVVKMPGGRSVVVDAKTNIEAYLEAIDATDTDVAEKQLERFARHVAEQAVSLSKKGYWQHFEGTPDLVIMFIPGDQFIDAALQRRPDLLESAAMQRVILASPSTLIGLLRAVNIGWREQRVSLQAAELLELGRQLHQRVGTVLEHAGALGKGLERSVTAYNSLVGSMERNLSTTARRFEELGARSDKTLDEPPLVEVLPRPAAAPGTAAPDRTLPPA